MTKNHAFTLVELAVVLTLLSIMIGVAVMENTMQATAKSQQITLNRIHAIEEALLSYYRTFNRLPCPATMNSNLDDNQFGLSANSTTSPIRCNTTGAFIVKTVKNAVFGSVPVKTLNLPDEYALDGWGRRMLYVMHDFYNEPMINRPLPTVADIFQAIPVYDHWNPALPTTHLIGLYPAMLIAYGKSGHGAVPPNGIATLNDRMQAYSPNSFEQNNIPASAAITFYPVKKAFIPDAKDANERFDQIVYPISLP